MNHDYAKLYDEYKAIYKEDKQKAKDLNDTFIMPYPEKWDFESVRLRAFLERDKNLYTNSLSPFEYLLKKNFDDSLQEEYEQLVVCYRDEYFSYKHKSADYEFMLGGEGESTTIAKEYVLTKNVELILKFLSDWQAKLDAMKAQNQDMQNIQALRLQEQELIQAFTTQLTHICSKVALYSQSLSKLLSDYEPKLLNSSDYKLKRYFDYYDLSDPVDVVEYLKSHKEHNITSDVLQIRQNFQTMIANNNRASEIEMTQSSDVGTTLLNYAALEQDIVVKYRDVIQRYFSYLGVEGDFELINRPFELYFDNYFADFENILKYYAYIYKGKTEILTQTPYYLKMFNATQEKISIVKLNAALKIENAKKAYVKDRNKLTELKIAEIEYKQEVFALLDEFRCYGELYITKIYNNSYDMQEHSKNVALFKERFNLKEENGFF